MRYLAVREGGTYVDCTAGAGGHSAAIAAAIGAEGRLLAIDQDSEALEFARTKLAPFGRRVSFVHGNFRELDTIAASEGFAGVDGILMDLGVSSLQLDRAERGFAFAKEGPLDMRMDRSSDGMTAADIVNTWDEQALADLFPGTGRGTGRAPHRKSGARGTAAALDLGSSQSRRADCGGRERPNPKTPRHQGFSRAPDLCESRTRLAPHYFAACPQSARLWNFPRRREVRDYSLSFDRGSRREDVLRT